MTNQPLKSFLDETGIQRNATYGFPKGFTATSFYPNRSMRRYKTDQPNNNRATGRSRKQQLIPLSGGRFKSIRHRRTGSL